MEEILHPGDLVFTRAPARLRTVLGSCVALTAWHARFRVGGMCHYLLPHCKEDHRAHNERYGDVALHEMWLKMTTYADPSEYELCLFGGASILVGTQENCVGKENIQIARSWLTDQGLSLKHEQTGGVCSRTVILGLDDGVVLLKEGYQK